MSKKRNKTPSNKVQETHEDFWDLGDDDLELNIESTAKEKESPQEEIESSDRNSSKETQEEPKSSKNDKPSKKPDKTENSSSKQSTAEPSELEIEEFDLEEDQSQQAEYKSSDSVKTEGRSVWKKEETGSRFEKKDTAPTTTTEKISLLLLLACLIGALGWGISAFFREAPQGSIIPFKEDYPAKGDIVTVSSVETWWKKPIRTGENADTGIVLEANLVPCAKIALSGGGSTTLRITFRNGEQNLIGDTINLIVEDGKFARSGSNTIEVYSTSGFDNPSKINSYTNGDIDPWALIITEGATGNEDDPLVKARISSNSNPQ